MTKKILIVAPAWLGDMVMTHSLIQVIRQRHPEASLSVLAPQATLQISELMPEISERILMPDRHGQFNLKARWTLAMQLRKQKFALAYVLPNTWKSALIPFLAGIPQRVGALGEQRYIVLNDVRQGVKNLPLMVQRYVTLGYPRGQFSAEQEFPYPRLQVPEILREQVQNKLQLDLHKPVLVLSPGAAFGPAKRWPPAYFAAVAEAKLAEGFQVWVIGGPAEQALGDEILALVPEVCHFVGKTSLLEMAALLSMASQVLTNDSGPMHIAASLNVPVFAIFGSSSAGFTPPLGDKITIIEKQGLSCRPCFQRVCPLGHYACLKEITPEQVLERMKS
jgi:heptosyltransferase-2